MRIYSLTCIGKCFLKRKDTPNIPSSNVLKFSVANLQEYFDDL